MSTFRSRCLLDLSHEMPCFADFPHQCTAYLGCEPAHSDSQIFGRGGWHKSADCFFASMCSVAHRMITAKVGGGMSRDEKFFAWLRAHSKTMEWLWLNHKIKVAA